MNVLTFLKCETTLLWPTPDPDLFHQEEQMGLELIAIDSQNYKYCNLTVHFLKSHTLHCLFSFPITYFASCKTKSKSVNPQHSHKSTSGTTGNFGSVKTKLSTCKLYWPINRGVLWMWKHRGYFPVRVCMCACCGGQSPAPLGGSDQWLRP